MKLLVVDDDPDFRGLITTGAPSWLSVIECAGSAEVIRLMEEGWPGVDVALIDVHLEPNLEAVGDLEGPALVRWLHARDARTPVILVSVDPLDRAVAASRPASPIGFLRKPVNTSTFYGFLESYRRLFSRR